MVFIPSNNPKLVSMPTRIVIAEEVGGTFIRCMGNKVVTNCRCLGWREVINEPAKADISQPDS